MRLAFPFLCIAALAASGASASALFTAGAGDVHAFTARAAVHEITAFTHGPANGDRQLLAVVSRTGSRESRTVVRWFPRRGGERALDLLGLERLYEHVLRQEPAGTFEFQTVRAGATGASPATRAGPTQGDALRAIAQARQRAVRDLAASGSDLKPTPWRVVSLKAAAPARGAKADPDAVSVRVHDADGQPIAGSTLTATRGEHMMCSARSDAHGRAACKLIDVHGHAATDDDDHGGPTVVTFPGIVSPERIELPTTLTIPARHPH